MKKFLLTLCLCLMPVLAFGASQFDFLLAQVRTSTTALVGGKVYFYQPGTTTLASVWLDRSGATPAANPYTLDSNGTAQIYGAGLYRVVVKDSAGVTRFDRDNISVSGPDGQIVAYAGSTTPLVLPTSGTACYMKNDDSDTTVLITPPPGKTIMGLSSYELYLQYETVCLSLIGTTYVRQ